MTPTPLAPWCAAALALHALLAATAPHAAPSGPPQPPPLEIDLAPPPPPPPSPPPLPTPTPEPAPKRAPAPAHAPAPAPAPAHAPAPAARAAPLLTAAPSPNNDPVSFVTDPNGTTFGYGVVARGNTAMQGFAPTATAAPAPPRPPPPAPEASTPPSDWTRAPKLEDADPCKGFFPRHAASDSGHVALVVVIDRTGHVASATVAEESPAGDGFGEAARTCLRWKVFTPALGREGEPVRATATVRIHFSR